MWQRIFSRVLSQEVLFFLRSYFPNRQIQSCSFFFIPIQLYKCSFLAYSAAKAEESNTSGPSLCTVWHSLALSHFLFPPLQSMCLRVVQTSVVHNWIKLPISVSCLSLSHQGEKVFLLKSSCLAAVIFTRDSSYECEIKASSQGFPSLHTSLSFKDVQSLHCCVTQKKFPVDVFFAKCKISFFFSLAWQPSPIIHKICLYQTK